MSMIEEILKISDDEIVSGLASLGDYLAKAANKYPESSFMLLQYAGIVAAAIYKINPEVVLKAAKEVEDDR